MLKINVLSLPEDCIERIDSYFNVFKKKEWFDNPVVRPSEMTEPGRFYYGFTFEGKIVIDWMKGCLKWKNVM